MRAMSLFSVYALRALLSALSPLIGAEEELGTAVQEGWAIDVGDAKLDEWKRHGMDLEDEVKSLVQVTMEKEYWALYRKVRCTPGVWDILCLKLIAPLFHSKLIFDPTLFDFKALGPQNRTTRRQGQDHRWLTQHYAIPQARLSFNLPSPMRVSAIPYPHIRVQVRSYHICIRHR